MADSLLTSLYSLLDPCSISSVANSLGVSDVASLKGLKSGIAAVLAGVVAKREDEKALKRILNVGLNVDADISQRFTIEASRHDSVTITAGKGILALLFGESEEIVVNAVGVAAGLQADPTLRILTMVAPIVLSVVANRARPEGMNMHGLRDLLQQESGGIRGGLPGGLEYLLWPRDDVIDSPVSAGLERERHPADWLPLLTLVLLIPAVIWFFSHGRKATVQAGGSVLSESKALHGANRSSLTEPQTSRAPERVDVDPVEVVKRLLLNNVDLQFDTGSATLQDGSRGQLDLIASTIVAYPDVHLTLTGHTDNTGGADANRRLARRRADRVMAELIRKGVPPDHLSAESESTGSTISDNLTEEDRAKNRCVTLELSPH